MAAFMRRTYPAAPTLRGSRLQQCTQTPQACSRLLVHALSARLSVCAARRHRDRRRARRDGMTKRVFCDSQDRFGPSSVVDHLKTASVDTMESRYTYIYYPAVIPGGDERDEVSGNSAAPRTRRS